MARNQVTIETDSGLRQLLLAASLCNNSKVLPPNGDGKNRWSILGDPTEAALIVAAKEGGLVA